MAATFHYTFQELVEWSKRVLNAFQSSLFLCSFFHYKSYIFFSSLKDVSQATDSNPFSVPSYYLYPHFRSKAGCCVYVRNDLTYSRAHALESSEFSIIWLQLQSHFPTKFFCAVYLSPNSSDYRKFFNYLTSKLEHIVFLSFWGDLHSWRLQCSPPALAFLSFHWPSLWTCL